MSATTLNHPALATVKAGFPNEKFLACEFRGQTSIIAPAARLHELMRLLRDHPDCDFNFLTDVTAVDYLGYPAQTEARFALVYCLLSHSHNRRLIVKVFLNPSLDTKGIEVDPALEVDSVTDLWEGAEWLEREVYDMFGIRFRGHPDLRRILMWRDFPAHPLRKDYPLHGRGERENFSVLTRAAR